MSSYVAFFDLDETIIHSKSLIEVYKAYFISERREKDFNESMEYFKDLQSKSISRNTLNTLFYENFFGLSREKMMKVIQNWFLQNKEKIDFFNQPVLKELREHQMNGATIIIISGSFYDCVAPIAHYLNVSDFLCIDLAHHNNIYTGKINGIQTIGEGKLTAISDYIKKNNLDLKGSYGYGDHVSDLPFLNFVENPVVVGSNCELITVAESKNWRVIFNEDFLNE